MKIWLSIFIGCALAPLSCAEEAKTYFPVSERGSATTVSNFEQRWYSKHLLLMEEASLFADRNDKEKDVYRFTLLPTWGDPRCVAIVNDEKKGKVIIRFSRLDGDGGYDPGKLVEKEQRELDKKEFVEFTNLFNAIDFKKQPTEDPVTGLDGSQWILERLKDGEYHIVVRWTANAYEPKKRGTEGFVKLCDWMLESAPRAEEAEANGPRQGR